MSRKILVVMLLGLAHCKGKEDTKKAHNPAHHKEDKKDAKKTEPERPVHHKQKTTPANVVPEKPEMPSSESVTDDEVRTLVLGAITEKAKQVLNQFKGQTLIINSVALAELASNAVQRLAMSARSHSNLNSVAKKLVGTIQDKLGAVLICLFLETGVCFDLDLPSILLPQMIGLSFQMKNAQFCPEEDRQKLLKALESGSPEEVRKVQAEVSKSILKAEEELQEFIDKLLCKAFDSCIQKAVSELEQSTNTMAEELEEDDWEN